MTLASKRIAIYARYSSDRQRETSIEDQVARCRRWVAERGGVVDQALVFCDFAQSAASLERPGWSALERAVGSGAVEVIVVEALDRVSRKIGDTAQLMERLRFAGVVLHAIGDGIDSSSRSAKVHTTIKGLVGDIYLDDLADKTRRGMEAAVRAGMAASAVPFGYQTRAGERGRVIEVHPEQAPIVRRIFDLYVGGTSRNEIAATLNREEIPPPRSSRRDRGTAASWQHTTIRAMLANETYAGTWTWNRREWRKVPGTNRRVCRERPRSEWIVDERPELALVDAQTWAAANARSTDAAAMYGQLAPAERRGSGRRSYLLSGILRCGACGSLMAIHGGGAGGRRYYRCSAASSRGTCTNRLSVLEREVRETFLGAMRDRLLDRELLEEVRAAVAEVLEEEAGDAAAERTRRKAALVRLEAKIERLVDALADGASVAIAGKLRELERQARDERTAIASLATTLDSTELPSVDEALQGVRELGDVLASGDIAAGRERLRAALVGGSITMTARDGMYVAEAGVLPPVLVGGARSDHRIAGAGFVGIRVSTLVRAA